MINNIYKIIDITNIKEFTQVEVRINNKYNKVFFTPRGYSEKDIFDILNEHIDGYRKIHFENKEVKKRRKNEASIN